MTHKLLVLHPLHQGMRYFPVSYELKQRLKLGSYSNAKIFSMLSGKVQHFYSDLTPPLSYKTLMQSVFRWPIESCVMSLKCSWSWTFFLLIEQHRSWDSVLISMYRIDAHDLKKKWGMCESYEKTLCVRMWI